MQPSHHNPRVHESSATGATHTRPGTKNKITLMDRPPTPPAQTTTRTKAPRNKPRTSTRHYDKPAGHTGTWCHHHGCVTHSTANCFARRKRTTQAKQATVSPDNDQQEVVISDLKERLQFLENMLAEQHETDDGKTKFILESGAHPTHAATPHANMPPSSGKLTQTANGQREQITHCGNITIQTKNRTIKLAAAHTPRITENLLSVHDLTAYGDVTFTRTRAYLHIPIPLPPSQLTATYKNGQYQTTTKTPQTAKGARTYKPNTGAIKKQSHNHRASRTKRSIKKQTHRIRKSQAPPHLRPRRPTRHGIPLAPPRKNLPHSERHRDHEN